MNSFEFPFDSDECLLEQLTSYRISSKYDSDVKIVVRDSISSTLERIFGYFKIDIVLEEAIRK